MRPRSHGGPHQADRFLHLTFAVSADRRKIKLLLTGDIMLGRGIDQALAFPSPPELHEPYIADAKDYLVLAEEKNGPIPRPMESRAVWGDALRILEAESPEYRIVNLETSITKSESWEPKGINYRMNPKNIDSLKSFKIDCAVLANNHVLDWGQEGLLETLSVLHEAGIQTAGAGKDQAEARKPAILESTDGRVLVFSLAFPTSGVPETWAASTKHPGVWLCPEVSHESILRVRTHLLNQRNARDLIVLSVHWGGNWGYEIPDAERRFAHAMIDSGAADIIHGHSSHHPKEIEIYRNKLILYGCGDLINDYEGITGYEEFRSDLSLLYLPTLDRDTGLLLSLHLRPLRIKNFRLNRASPEETDWLRERIQERPRPFSMLSAS